MVLLPSPRSSLVLALLLGLCGGCQPRLEPGDAYESTIGLDEHQRVSLDLEAGLFYHLVVEQPTADVVLTLLGPDGEAVDVDVDATPPGEAENLYFIPPRSGRYVLDIFGLALSVKAEGGEGSYGLKLLEPKSPSAVDKVVAEAFWEEMRALKIDSIEEDCHGAIEHYERAVSLWEQADRSYESALVLLELGICYHQLGAVERGRAAFEQTLEVAEAQDRQGLRFKALTTLGVSNRALGRYQTALGYHREALALADVLANPKWIGRAQNNVCYLYMELGRMREAWEACQKALEIYESLGWKTSQIRTLGILGSALGLQGEWAQAVEVFQKALDLEPESSRLKATVTANYARALAATEELGLAEDLLLEALALNLKLGEQGGEAYTRSSLARVLLDLGRLEEARQHASRAFEASESLGDVVVNALVLSTVAQVDMASGHLENGLVKSDEAFRLLEEVRRTPDDFDDRSTFLASKWLVYDTRVAVRMALFDESGDAAWRGEALHAAEQARARGLLDMLQASQARKGIGLLAPAEVQGEVLDASTGLLQFHLGREKSFLWRLTAEQIDVFTLPAAEEVRAMAGEYYQALVAREDSDGDETLEERGRRIAEADAVLGDLGRRLVEVLALDRAARRLEGETLERWLIVPDGVLHRIPFGALPQAGAADPSRPLAADFEVVYAPSASILAALRAGESTVEPHRSFLAFADPVFVKGDPRNPAGTEEADHGEALARLPLTRDEARSIAGLAPGEATVAMDHAASKERFLAPETGSYAFLHVATHGLIDARAPSQTALVLSRFDAEGRVVDGRLELRDLYSSRLGAELVVLSACRSARGRELRGEGLLGLSRGFMNAGVPSIVASLWTVEDGVTRELMVDFYRRVWSDGERPAAALRQAQLRLWRRGLPPYHWAAFAFQGEWR